MSHFLSRLIERARGTAPRVEPVIAPRFAPAPIAEIATETEAAAPARRQAGKKGTTIPMQGSAGTKDESATRETGNGLVEKATEAAPQTLLVPPPEPADEMAPGATWTRESESLRRDELPLVQSAAAPPVVRRANPPARLAPIRPPHRPAVAANSLSLPSEQAQERPIVRVTIGRIEVRATPAAAPTSRKTVAPSPPLLTLDAYLKAKKEGRR